jgi:hypothetical protein
MMVVFMVDRNTNKGLTDILGLYRNPGRRHLQPIPSIGVVTGAYGTISQIVFPADLLIGKQECSTPMFHSSRSSNKRASPETYREDRLGGHVTITNTP